MAGGKGRRSTWGAGGGTPSVSPSTTIPTILKYLRSSPCFLFSPCNASHGALDKEAHYMTVLWLHFATHIGLKLRLGASQQSPDQQALTLAPDTSVQILEFLPSLYDLIFLISSWVSHSWNGMTVSSHGIVTKMPSNCVSSAYHGVRHSRFCSYYHLDLKQGACFYFTLWITSMIFFLKKMYWSIVNIQCCVSIR